MKLLIVGAGSAVGKELLKQLQQRQIEFFAPDSTRESAKGSANIDPGDPLSVARVITQCSPDQVINLASYAAGSQLALTTAEEHAAECEAVNFEQSAVLAQVCDHLNIPLIHLSSAYVFAGDKKLAYSEQDETRPVGVYGSSTLAGEQAISSILVKHVILRTGWLFGHDQDEMLKGWIADVKKNDGVISAVRRKFSPTPVEDVARVLVALALQIDCEANVWGTYHYCALESRKEGEFVKELLKLAAQHDESVYRLLDHLTVNPMKVDEPEIANSTLSTKKIFDTFGIKQRSWHGSLQALVKSYYMTAKQSE